MPCFACQQLYIIGFGTIVVLILLVIAISFHKFSRLYVQTTHLNEIDRLIQFLHQIVTLNYNMIFRYHILSYKLSNASLDRGTLDKLRIQFLDMVYSTLGKKNTKLLINYFGDKTSLDTYILLLFEYMLDEDLVRIS